MNPDLLRFMLIGGWPDGPSGGLLVNLGLAAMTMLVGFVVAIPLALLRCSASPRMALPVTLFVELVRSTPLLLLVFWCHFLLPLASGGQTSPLFSAFVALSLYSVANQIEIARAGFAGVPRAEIEAGMATGLSQRQILSQLVVPQGLRRMVPTSSSFAVSLLKDTAVIYVVGIVDLVQAGLIAAERKPSQMLGVYLAMAGCFAVAAGAITYVGKRFEQRLLRFSRPITQ